MHQRYMCSSMGAIRRSLSRDIAAVSNYSSRAFHGSARMLEEPSGSGAASSSAPAQPQRDTRKARNTAAFNKIAGLQARRPNANVAGGAPPSGQHVQRPVRPRTPRAQQPTGVKDAQNAGSPAVSRRSPGTAPPASTMIRAPSKLRVTRNVPGQNRGPQSRGPNLRGREPRRVAPGRSAEAGPRKREKKAGDSSRIVPGDTKPEATLSDGMVQHLLRLQRKEWDRVPYEPKYTPGSFAANELIYKGKELFAGESPPVKVWGRLERKIGVVGMYNAEARLQIRRVPDGDQAPFGQEELDEPVDENFKRKEATA